MGTGHRPQDTPAGYQRYHPWKLQKISLLENYLKENRPDIIISGMAVGWDVWLAHTAIKLGIPFWAYIPFKGQEKLWSADHQRQYHAFLAKASLVKVVCEGEYAAWKMQRRNEAMLNDSDVVLALYNDAKRHGGTYNCIVSAFQQNKPIINFWDNKPENLKLFK